MKATLAACTLALILSGVALVQYDTVRQLRQQLADSTDESSALRKQVQMQTEANAQLQDSFEQQITRLQENLQSSSRQLVLLSESLQEARELIQANNPAGAVPPPLPVTP